MYGEDEPQPLLVVFSMLERWVVAVMGDRSLVSRQRWRVVSPAFIAWAKAEGMTIDLAVADRAAGWLRR